MSALWHKADMWKGADNRIRIGNEIRAKGFWTFIKCGTLCESACALAWLGVVHRTISPAGFVGFHAAYDAVTRLESGEGNALVGAYLARLGLSDAAIAYITHMGPNSMQWLSAGDAVKIGIEASELDYDRQAIVPFAPLGGDRQSTRLTQEQQKLADIFTGFVAAWSSIGDNSYVDRTHQLDFLLSLSHGVYADKVLYYGQPLTSDQVIDDKEAFMRKWPQRDYRVRPGTLSISCVTEADCYVSAIVEYRISNSLLNTETSEAAVFRIRSLREQNGRRVITEESTRQLNAADDRAQQGR
jgi:hypothetical protein